VAAFWRDVSLHRAEEVVPVLDEVAATLTALGSSRHDCHGVRLALEEAVVNGLRQGNRWDPAKRVRVGYRAGPDTMLAVVDDEGKGFDPESVPDPTLPENLERPGGRGLLLMRHYMTWVCFPPPGKRVLLAKRRSRYPLAPPARREGIAGPEPTRHPYCPDTGPHRSRERDRPYTVSPGSLSPPGGRYELAVPVPP
jgi:serine/threonine-protein kinase RsbW